MILFSFMKGLWIKHVQCFDPLRLRYSEDQIVSFLINRSLLNLAPSLMSDKMSRGHLVNIQTRVAVSL